MSFAFDQPASSADVTFALGRQGTKGTPASAVHEVIHTGGDEGPGLLVDQGQLEVGAGYYTGNQARKVGSRPSFNAAGRAYLRALALMLYGAGLSKKTVGGTPATVTLEPATAPSEIPYYTFVADYGAPGPKIQQLDSRIAVAEVNIVPGQPIQARMAGLGRNHMVSSLTPSADPNRLEPSVVADIAAANAVIFGQNDACFRAVDLIVTQALFADNQCIGEAEPQDIVPTGLIVTLSGVLACNDDIYRALAYGGASATETGAAFQGGAFKLRVSTDGNIGPTAPNNVPGYLELSFTDGRYWMPTNVVTTPGRDVVVPWTAVATSGCQAVILDGSDFSYLS